VIIRWMSESLVKPLIYRQCIRCEKFGIDCDGYSSPDPSVLVQKKTQVPLLLPRPASIAHENLTRSPNAKTENQHPVSSLSFHLTAIGLLTAFL